MERAVLARDRGRGWLGLGLLTLALAAMGSSASACAARAQPLSTAAKATRTAAARPTSAAASGEATPVTYTTPHPAPVASPLDGTYARLDSAWPQWWKRLRCADYRSAGGIWRLRFEQGTMRIEYEVTGWTDLASYAVEADRLTVFNDPNCPDDVAQYRWRVQGGLLLDGQEVWRGRTAELGRTLEQYGGYVEASGFDLGAHTLRVESLDWDYRPVTVASFGFRFNR